MTSPDHRHRQAPPSGDGLLGPDDPAPVSIINHTGSSPFLLTGDHAGLAIPTRLGRLGLTEADLARHIASDIGVAGLGALLAERLDAAFISQTYSRLVIDCNRDPASDEAIPAISDGTAVPANAALDPARRMARVNEIHAPYHAEIARLIARRKAAGIRTIPVALHSFTPVMAGSVRPWDIGILHNGGDATFARAVLAALRTDEDIVVGDNQPYRMDATDHSVPRHAYPSGLPYVEVEFRQDLVADTSGQAAWAARFADALLAADQGRRSVAGSPGSGSMP